MKKKLITGSIILAGLIVLINLSLYAYVQIKGKSFGQREQLTDHPIAIVFGAGLWQDRPSPILTDRVATAVELYEDGQVQKILMSGDNSYVDYNEPQAMRELAIELGVPAEDVVLDYAGRRTYDTCYRANEIFAIERAVLVTNDYHLPRALYTCNALGVDSVGVNSDLRSYADELEWKLREVPASIVAWWQVHVSQPEPILGEREPINMN